MADRDLLMRVAEAVRTQACAAAEVGGGYEARLQVEDIDLAAIVDRMLAEHSTPQCRAALAMALKARAERAEAAIARVEALVERWHGDGGGAVGTGLLRAALRGE